jgi:hypothetical protein
MADEPTSARWLPPEAPGGQPPPRFDMVVPEAQAAPVAPHVAPAPAGLTPTGARPTGPRSGQAGMGSPGAPRFERAPSQTNGLALAAVILGVLGLGLLALTLGLGFPFALPLSIAAWICGAQARNRILLGESTHGRGQANAGYLLGVAGVVLGVAAGAGWIIWMASGGDLEQLQRDLERWRDEQTRQAVVRAALALLGR